VLARIFNISAEDALFVRPAWELDNLLARYARDVNEDVHDGD
jgi:phosphotransferase system HPr-like phosphotransfer protein